MVFVFAFKHFIDIKAEIINMGTELLLEAITGVY